MKKISLALLVTASCGICCCQKKNISSTPKALFDSVPVVRQVTPLLEEISGIADSKINPGYIWGEEDSGNPNQVYLLNHNGTVAKTVYLKGIINRDWEDMALADDTIYIAETGDNAQVYSAYHFYKFAEPSLQTDTVTNIQTINFTYPDGSHDAEAFVVDESKNIYIITKRDNPSRIYKLTFPYQANNIVTPVGTLPYSGVVSAALNKNEIIVKTYPTLYYYKRQSGDAIPATLKKQSPTLPYQIEPQGEAVGFAIDGSGYYTISEKGFATWVNIYFYKRK
ncbi:MAG: hypothetical protein ACXVBH_04095 [Flavisolibacter sp.]